MEENKDFQTNDENTSKNNSVDLDKLVNSIPEQININQEVEETPEKPKFEGYRTNTLLFHFLCVFGVVFLSIFFVFNVYFKPITVVGQSMLPTINAQTTSNDDITHTDMVYYREKESYTYGDIVIVSNEESHYINNTKRTSPVNFLIKRVVACPGDTITFYFTEKDEQNHLYYYNIIVKNSNGEVVDLNEESYVKESMYLYFDPLNPTIYNDFYKNFAPKIINELLPDSERKATITISKNCYFVMGDNRNNSSDSRSFGEVMFDDICGNVRILVKHGESIWGAVFKKIKSHLSVSYKLLKEYLWKRTY